MRLNFELQGMNRLLSRLRHTEDGVIYAEPWTKALTSLVEEGVEEVKRTAPRDTGALEAKTRGKLQANPIPKWGVITTGATRKGYRYPWALEFSTRYHYRSGSRKGQRTKGYFLRVEEALQGKVNRVLESAAREIERRFNQG